MTGNGAKPEPIYQAVSVTKAFGGLVAVDNVSFEIPRGGIVSIIGPNGAGKTTFFNILTGLYKPTTGRLVLGERDVTRKRPDQITAAGVARTFQNIRLFGTMSAVENVMVGQHARMKAGLIGSIFRPPWVLREEDRVREPPGRPGPIVDVDERQERHRHEDLVGDGWGDLVELLFPPVSGHDPQPPGSGVPGTSVASPSRKSADRVGWPAQPPQPHPTRP